MDALERVSLYPYQLTRKAASGFQGMLEMGVGPFEWLCIRLNRALYVQRLILAHSMLRKFLVHSSSYIGSLKSDFGEK